MNNEKVFEAFYVITYRAAHTIANKLIKNYTIDNQELMKTL